MSSRATRCFADVLLGLTQSHLASIAAKLQCVDRLSIVLHIRTDVHKEAGLYTQTQSVTNNSTHTHTHTHTHTQMHAHTHTHTHTHLSQGNGAEQKGF